MINNIFSSFDILKILYPFKQNILFFLKVIEVFIHDLIYLFFQAMALNCILD